MLNDYYKKRTITSKQSYAVEIVRRGQERLRESTQLTALQENIFTEFNTVVVHLFDSIRLRRNGCTHPKHDLVLNELPTLEVVRANIQAFNPYAKVLLEVAEIFHNSRQNQARATT